MENLYRNPFSDYNANTMNSEQITHFWENPFENYVLDISEKEFACEKKTIMFTGGRGTGKTMLLKHFELDSAIVRAANSNKDLKQAISELGYVGLYIRFDSPLLKGFSGSQLDENKWEVIFSHFFEITIMKTFVDALIKLIERNVISNDEYIKLFPQLQEDSHSSAANLQELSRELRNEINYVNSYRAQIILDDVKFSPKQLFTCGEIIPTMIKQIKGTCSSLANVNFLVLIDEYENFLQYQQKIVNSIIKLSDNIAFRIGMRPMGFHTYDTVSENEFIKEKRDYRNVLLENPLIRKDGGDGTKYITFLLGIAEKRLKSVPLFAQKNMTNLASFLGEKEDPVAEAKKIVKGRETHFEVYLKEIEKVYKKKNMNFAEITKAKLEELKSPDNPLFEMQNLRLLLKPYPIDYVIKAYHDYREKVASDEARKYRNDYVNKYKLAYVFVLRSIYRVESKLYYGVNDFAYLSSGIAGTFVELCRCTFQHAYFSAKDDLFSGHISPEIQTKAVRDVGKSELEQIKRISKVGSNVYNFTINIAKRFIVDHVDKRIKYPETNQISFNSSILNENTLEKDTFQAAIMWSVIQTKRELQQAGIGKDDEEIYVLNRVFAPVFNISARTRGGKNEELNLDKFKQYIEKVEGGVTESIETEDEADTSEQIGMFDNIIPTAINE